jgi:hypothetical protein
MSPPSKEARIILALEALENDENLSLREAVKIYNVSRMTLTRRHAGRPIRRDATPNLKKLT